MSAIVLSIKASKLMKVCEAEGFATVDDLVALRWPIVCARPSA